MALRIGRQYRVINHPYKIVYYTNDGQHIINHLPIGAIIQAVSTDAEGGGTASIQIGNKDYEFYVSAEDIDHKIKPLSGGRRKSRRRRNRKTKKTIKSRRSRR
jgi:hypothetical protein